MAHLKMPQLIIFTRIKNYGFSSLCCQKKCLRESQYAAKYYEVYNLG